MGFRLSRCATAAWRQAEEAQRFQSVGWLQSFRNLGFRATQAMGNKTRDLNLLDGNVKHDLWVAGPVLPSNEESVRLTVCAIKGACRSATMFPGTSANRQIPRHHGFGDGTREIAMFVLSAKLGKLHAGLGSRAAHNALCGNVASGGDAIWFVIEAARLHFDGFPAAPGQRAKTPATSEGTFCWRITLNRGDLGHVDSRREQVESHHKPLRREPVLETLYNGHR